MCKGNGICKISVPYIQFCHKPQNCLKIKSIIKSRKKMELSNKQKILKYQNNTRKEEA
jgi:hypothetical protein